MSVASPPSRPSAVRHRSRRVIASIAASTMTLACSADQDVEVSVPDAVTPAGFESVLVSVMPIDGVSRELCMWVADTPERRARGMMGATGFGEAEAMVFAQPAPSTGTFWMKNTLIPLSIAYFDSSGEFLSSDEMTPCTTPECERYSTAVGYRWAVEAPSGGLAGLGLVEGSTISVSDRPCPG